MGLEIDGTVIFLVNWCLLLSLPCSILASSDFYFLPFCNPVFLWLCVIPKEKLILKLSKCDFSATEFFLKEVTL